MYKFGKFLIQIRKNVIAENGYAHKSMHICIYKSWYVSTLVCLPSENYYIIYSIYFKIRKLFKRDTGRDLLKINRVSETFFLI